MPELPEVELAIRRLRPHVLDRRIAELQRLHPSTRRALSAARTRRLIGQRIATVDRRGKYQLLSLEAGDTLVAHFRLDGDWHVSPAHTPLPRHARLAFVLDDDTRAALVDPRALATVTWHPPGADPIPGLGPEPFDPSLTPDRLHRALASRRAAIKLVLLDQHLLAGVGNIYAAEALWHARIHPDTPANQLGRQRVARLLDGVRLALAKGLDEPGRVYANAVTGETAQVLMAYGRTGEPCVRCGRPIRRVVHAARGTWYCPRCQR